MTDTSIASTWASDVTPITLKRKIMYPAPTDEQVDALLRQLKPEVVTGSLADLFRDDYRQYVRDWLKNL